MIRNTYNTQKDFFDGPKRKEPAYNDDDLMPFGKYKGERLMDLRASYLLWFWEQRPLSDIRLENYIHNSLECLRQEQKKNEQ